MRVKITQPGWELFNDVMFGVQFEDAVSVGELRRDQALQLGAMISVVEIDENGEELGPVSPTHEMVLNMRIAAEVVEPMKSDAELANDGVTAPVEPESVEGEPGADVVTETKVYTEDELVAIADEKGIAGLRTIGEPLNVKNTAIKGLIREILAAQNGQ